MELKDMELKERGEGLTTFVARMSQMDLDRQMIFFDTLQELIYRAHREFTPMYPLVLVLVLRKQQVRASGIALPDSQQNKPMHEGIVLATWNSKLVERGTINKDGERLTRVEVLHSQLKPGDHVLFHHWAGMPIHGFDDQRFRVVREEAWHETQQGGIVGVLHYSDKENEPLEAIANELIGSDHAGYSLTEWALTKSKIRDRYIVIDKETSAVTLSGA